MSEKSKVAVQTVTEKKAGVDILEAAADAIQSAPLARLNDERKNDLISELRIQCRARKDELIPEERSGEIITKVMYATMSIAEIWPNEVVDFVSAQAGRERVEQYVANHSEELAMITCPCGKCGCLVVTPEIARQYREQVDDLPSSIRRLIRSITRD